MDTGLLSVVVVVLVVAGVAALVWWSRRARAAAGGGPPAAPADAHAIAASLHGVYQASAYPRDLLPHAAFERGVALLARDAHGPDELMQYAAGANPMLACMALEALARRRPGGVADHQLLALVNMDFRWPRYFLLRALQAGASGPLAGEVVVRLDETWNEPVPRMMLREFLADRVRAGETLAVGDRLGALPRARLEEVTTVLEGLEDAAVAPMLEALRRVRAASVDLVELATFGRVWTDEELDGDEVVLDAVRQAAGQLEAELRKRPARSMIVVGEPGVGKSTVVRELARRLRPERWLLLEATAADVIAGQVYIGQIEERVKKLVAAVAGRPVLVVVPNVHELVWTGTHRFSPTGLLDLILPHVERGAVTFVGETTPRAWQSMAQARPKLRSLLGVYRVDPLDAEAALDLARQWLERRQARRGGPRVGEAVLLEAAQLVRHYLVDREAPGNLLAFLDAALRRLADAGRGTGDEVRADDLVDTLSQLTGVPAAILDERERLDLDALTRFFRSRVLGQDEAVACLVERVAMVKAGVTDPGRPQGVFLFVGPTGTGKTEIARTLAEFLFGAAERMIRIDMSELTTPESIERLVGDPEERGTALVDAIRKQPFSVVLLDELEKASPVIWNLFLQVFDAGRLTDRRGSTADFRHAVIIMTSNLGATVARDAGVGFAAADPRFSPAAVERALGGVFPPEFLNRIDRVVVFRPLDRPTMREILRKELDGVLTRRGLRNRTWAVEWDESAIEFLLEQGFTPALGARPLRRAVERWVLAPLALAIVNRQVPEGDQFLFVRSDGDRVEVEFVDPDAPARGPAVEADRSPTPADLRLEDLVLDARGAPGELQLLRAEARRIGERVAAPELRRRKEQALAEMSASAFWTAPSRFEILGMAEYLDRLEQAQASVASLLRRLEGPGGRPRPHYPADVVRRLAQLLYLMDAACDGLAKGRPRDAFLSVTAIRDAGVPPETSDGFAARLDAMYRAWARRRRMRLEIVEEPSPEGAPYRSVQAVSGFAAFVILEPEAGMHVLEVPEPDGAFARARARVAVAPQPDEPANRTPGGLRAQAATALAAAGAGAPVVVRRYREAPSPLVRDTVRQWRTGRLDRVLAGDFDLIVPRAGQTTGEDGPIGGP